MSNFTDLEDFAEEQMNDLRLKSFSEGQKAVIYSLLYDKCHEWALHALRRTEALRQSVDKDAVDAALTKLIHDAAKGRVR